MDTTAGNRNDYVVGTLRYNRSGLIRLFFWLLVGDFAFALTGNAFSHLSALSMKSIGVSNTLMSFSMIVLPCVINLAFLPMISMRSDRHRGRFGRRIPYIFWPTPVIALFLVLFGYSDLIGGWLHARGIGKAFGISPYPVIMTVVCANLLLYQFFNLFVSTIYYYLWVDVIPEKFMGRFIALFRMVGQLAVFIWSRYILGLADHYLHPLYLTVGILYLVSFVLMCWKVREGEYPPVPAPLVRPRLIDSVQTYFRECFRHRIYVAIYLASGLYWTSWCMNAFVILFAQKTLGLSLDQFGKITSWCSLVAIPLLYALGYASDKIHPVRMNLLAVVITAVVALGSFFGIHNEKTMLIFSLLNAFSVLCYTISNVPLTAALYPKDRYGQFGSAEGMVMAIAMLAGGGLLGVYLDWMGSYRYIYLWRGVMVALALIPLTVVCIEWRRHGGARHYVPPCVNVPDHTPSTLPIETEIPKLELNET